MNADCRKKDDGESSLGSVCPKVTSNQEVSKARTLSALCEVISDSQVLISILIKPLKIYDGPVLQSRAGKNLNLTYCSFKLTQICAMFKLSHLSFRAFRADLVPASSDAQNLPLCK